MSKFTAIGRNINALVELRSTTQSAVASVAGASTGAVSSWISGRNKPKDKYLQAIADFYGVSMDDLTSEQNGLYAQLHGLTSAPSGAVAVSSSSAARVPIRVLGTVHAGEADEPWEVDDEAMLYEDMAKRHPNCFALDVNGSCMDRVFTDSDRVFVDPDMAPSDGSIAVMMVDGQAVVRRVKRGSDSLLLVAESHETHPDIIVRDSSARCLGCVFWWQARSEL